MGIINLSESEERIKELTLTRSISSLMIFGRYRVIDFVLSNMTNSGLTNVGIFTHGKSRSLTNHLGSGKHWGLDRKRDGLFLFHEEQRIDDNIRRRGDLENFKDNLDYLRHSNQEYVIISRSYMVCNIDYSHMVQHHKNSDADITIAYKSMENRVRRFVDCDSLTIGKNNKVLSIGKNMGRKKHYDISMEMYVLKRELLIKIVEDAIHRGDARFVKEALFNRMESLKVGGYPFKGYLSCVNSIQNYYLTNMDLLDISHSKDLFYEHGLIYTKVFDSPSTQYADSSYVSNSLVANGCIIEGTVEDSVLCRDVQIKKGAIVRSSIVFPNAVVHETTNLKYTILDKNVVITKKKMLFGDSESPFVIKKNTIL